MKHGKKYNESAKLIERNTLYDPADALALAVKTGNAKFDETVEVHVRLGV
ncbi:MAG: 50S ribosomal protein L1, partial [Clostridia bacterium]|nr:50S ribosomal protein L1 [Clostridia bacterium]